MKLSGIIKKQEELTHAAPLAVFRILFGAVMFLAVIRFLLNGWVYEQYIKPDYFFSYYGFEWVKPLPGNLMYLVFGMMGLSALLISLGFFYRISSLTFFLLFTYVELLDKSNYLNHYYFVSIISFLLIFLPAHRYFSLDVRRGSVIALSKIPRLYINVLKLQLLLVYFFAGLAKVNYEWLIEAMPLRIWLPAKSDFPLIGSFFGTKSAAYLFSWAGCIYDLTIPFFLLNRSTRPFAYIAVIVFHLLTYALFQIGIFPWVMIITTLIFFDSSFHQKLISLFNRGNTLYNNEYSKIAYPVNRVLLALFCIHFFVQIAVPLRHFLYPGNLFWTEEGYRFSWRVMLMEKAGTAFFYVKDATTNKETEINNCDFLTRNQEKMMATQPDMIAQFAHHLKDEYTSRGYRDPSVRAEIYVNLNGKGSRLFIDPSFDLTTYKESFRAKEWIIDYEENKELLSFQ